MGIKVGIDLGTTYSAIARISPETGKPVVIKNEYNESLTPSAVCITNEGYLYGEDAKQAQENGDTNSVAFFKRSMGNKNYSVEILGKNYNATDFSAIFLKHLKEVAEQKTGEKIDGAVITVPAYFTHIERTATIEAGKRAGLNVIAIINEPTAAAFAYGLNKTSVSQTILIYDLGGGTFDVTIAKIDLDSIDVIGSDGDHALGGKDWDDCIANYLAEQFEEKTGLSLAEDPSAVAELLIKAENVKKQLSSRNTANTSIIYKGKRETLTLTEETFEAISEFLLGTTANVTERLLSSIKMTWKNIDGVILVGGSTRMQMVQKYVKKMCGKDPLFGVNVDEAVALGAAIRANIDTNGTITATLGGKKKEQNIPVIGAKSVSDVTAHSMGMISQSSDGKKYKNSIIIPKNKKIPASNSRSYKFNTLGGNSEMEVYVVQGEYERPLDNTIVNKYVINGIRKSKPATTEITISYEYTSNGVIQVFAKQKGFSDNLNIRVEEIPEDMSWTDRPPENSVQKRTVKPNVEVMVCVDLSYSMSKKPIKKAMEAIIDFINQMDSSCTKLGLTIFADKCEIKLAPTKNYDDLIYQVNTLSKCVENGVVGYSNEAEPFTTVFNYFSTTNCDIKYIVVLTDGLWDDSIEDQAIMRAQKCHKNDIEVMALGFGSADYNFLKKIASTDSFASLTNLTELSASFSKIAQEIGSNIIAM